MADDPFRGAFSDGKPRDPGHAWYQNQPMPPDRLETVLNEALKDWGITGYKIVVTKTP
jgi:hypothetical protein